MKAEKSGNSIKIANNHISLDPLQFIKKRRFVATIEIIWKVIIEYTLTTK